MNKAKWSDLDAFEKMLVPLVGTVCVAVVVCLVMEVAKFIQCGCP